VICAYSDRRFKLLQAAVAAVLDQTSTNDEVVVVIDHNEQLLELARASLVNGGTKNISGPPAPIRVIPNQNEQGLSGARNTGVSHAGGDLVVFLDDDAVPRSGWLSQLTQAFADPTVIGIGGLAAPAWEAAPPAWLPEEFHWVVGCSYKGLPQHPAEIRNPIGANMAFRRTVIEQAGGFTDGLGRVGRTPLGCEETEFSIRATRVTGGRIMYEPQATVDHLVTVDRLQLRYFLRRCWAEGISKAIVSRLAGSEAALASERTYATRTLPLGVLAGVRDGFRGERNGFARAGAIIAGLTITAAGYLRGRVA
jgi:GT2 family glycosyltransferase